MHSRAILVGLSVSLAAWSGLLATPLAAQTTTGGVTGVVLNEQSLPVEDAQIQVTNQATGFSAGVRTNTQGRYVVPGLEVGSTYSLAVRRIGYSAVTRNNIVVRLGQFTREDIRLTTQAAVLSNVAVTAVEQDPTIAPSHTGIGTTINDTALRRLPTLNRNFTDFVALTPQVSTSGPGLSGGGTNNRFNNIQIDGATEADLFGLGSTGQPGGQANGKSIGLEAVKEYQVLLSPFDVRQGNFSGLLVNAVTKSGTNELHGSLLGVTRNQSFARSQPYINKYEQSQYALSVGGPIIKDRVFFFLNPEWQVRSTPAAGPYVGLAGTNLSQARVDSFTTALRGYGLPTGSAGLVTNDNPLTNIFARLDFNLPHNMQLVLRHNYGKAQDDNFSRSTSSFGLANAGYKFRSNKNATVAQLRSLFTSGSFNELLLNYTTIRDARAPNAGRSPSISVLTPGYTLVSGAERFSQGNELDQDIFEITDNFTLPVGNHRVTFGTQNQFYKVRNLFTQASYGVWQFASIDSLRNGLPNQYIVGVPLSGDGAVRFKAAQYAAYIQDEWNPSSGLNVSYGIRADIPTFGSRPPFNKSVQDSLGRNTTKIPSGNIQWSPRVGVNWDVTGDQVNQLRGGVGLFTGRPAFVWLSNAFQNSGSVGVGVLTCNAASVPGFNSANISSPPSQCTNGISARAGGEIDLLDQNTKFPQNLRATAGYDRRLTSNWVATLEALYTRGVNGLFYQNIALAGPQGVDKYGRTIYGNAPFAPVTVSKDRNQVFDVSNQSKDHAYNLTAQLQRRYANNYQGSVSYTYGRAWDVQDFTSSTAFSQYRFGRPWAGDQRDLTPTRSMFEQRHRIVATGSYTFPTKTDLTFTYFGQSGTPYGYVVNGDPNGDGVSLNDPIYIPRNVTDPNEIRFAATRTYGGTVYTAAQMATALDAFIKDTPCLDKQRGHIIDRNSCDNPWTNQLNVSARQSLTTIGMQNVTFQVDVFNFLNLLNKNWGEQPSAGFGSQTLLDYVTRTPTTGNLLNSDPVYAFNPGYKKFQQNNLQSNYQIQLQLRYSF